MIKFLMARRHLSGEFIRFSVVGTIGFIVDSAVLYVSVYLFGVGLYAGRVVSYLVAATTTWFLNRQFTFRGRDRARPHRQWARFLVVNGIGGLLNYGVYALMVANIDVVAEQPVLGVAAGSISGLFFNFVSSRQLVFRHRLPANQQGG